MIIQRIIKRPRMTEVGQILGQFESGPQRTLFSQDRIITRFEITCMPRVETWVTPGVKPKFHCQFSIKDRMGDIPPDLYCEITPDGFDIQDSRYLSISNLKEVERHCVEFVTRFLEQ